MYKQSQNSEITDPCLKNYDNLTSLFPFEIVDYKGDVHGPITYSLINSVLHSLLESGSNKRCCIGGRIELFFKDPFDSDEPVLLENKAFAEWFLPDDVEKFDFVYIPVTASWVHKKEAKLNNNATQNRNPLSRYTCNGRCSNGHAMACLVDNKKKTIEYFDSDGIVAPWYERIYEFIQDFFYSPTSPFKNHQFRMIYPFDVRENGLQDIVEMPLCALYATLYVWSRTQEEQPRKQLLTKWHKWTKKQALEELCNWQKFLDKQCASLKPVEKQIIPLFEQTLNHELKHGKESGKDKKGGKGKREGEENLELIAIWLFYNIEYATQLMHTTLDNCSECSK